MHSKKAIIIGSGIAGMAIATRLFVQGFEVSVYEKNDSPGGKANQLIKDGYNFDTGPSLFTQPGNIEELFADAGENINDYISYKKVPIACKYFYENGTMINGYTEREAFASELQEKLSEDKNAVLGYLSNAKKMYENIAGIFLNHSLQKAATWLQQAIIKALVTVRLPYIKQTLADFNQGKFRSEEVKQLFNRYATYNGSNPYAAPAMLAMISHLEHNEGVFYPAGGMISITKSLYSLALKKGVHFYFGNPVERIIHHEGIARGIVVNGENIYSDIVVSNADVYFTYQKLASFDYLAKKVLKAERSSSAIIFYWGINRVFPSLDLHNIFFSSRYKEEFDYIFTKKAVSGDPTIYVNITSKMESGHAPEKKENWFVMVNTPADYGQDWEIIQQQLRATVIAKLSRLLDADFYSCIETEEIVNPTILAQQTGCYMGAIYGGSSNSKWAAFSRPGNFTNYISNLYFCGGTVHPGGGIPLCLKSAQITANLVSKDFNPRVH